MVRILFVLLLFSPELFAKEVRYLVRSPRALLMGDAFTSIADDEYTLFYNPAALGRGNMIDLDIINPDIGATNALDDLDRFKDFPKDAPAIADRVMGFPVYIHAGATPGLKFGPFALSLFASATTSVVLRNAVYPQIDIDYRLDRGFIAGYAHTWGSGGKYEKKNPFDRKKKKLSVGRATSLGFAVKNINRQGLQGSYSLFGTTLLTEINNNSSDFGALRKALGYAKGTAWGADAGVEHVISTDSTEFAAAFSMLDIGGTDFKTEEGEGKVPEQEMVIALGASWRQDFTLLDYTLSFDLHPINQNVGLARMMHIGMEIGLPIVTAHFGYNEGYFSYGVSANLWFVKITAGFYGVELGTEYKENQGKRAVVYISLLDFEFSP